MYFYPMAAQTYTTTSFLYFTRKERRGTLFLFVLVALCCISPFLYALLFPAHLLMQESDVAPLQQLALKQAEAYKTENQRRDNYQPYDYPEKESYTRYATDKKIMGFNFDPNSINEAGWKKLGLRQKTITIIMNFRNKGGRFYKAEDIRKVWGLFPDEAERLIPFVQIGGNTFPEKSSAVFEKKKVIRVMNVNDADSTMLEELPGIGAKLSQRIVNFREKLGGFYSVDQIGETFGLQDSIFQKIKGMFSISGELRKINLNTVSLDELKAHPYIRYQLANAIIAYRTQHGRFEKLSDLRKMMILDDKQLEKIAPYLAFE